ncbi:hypothetical protein BGZ65_005298 [Modicella reniformis]|uniref:F-box domain-containing protein n=1 Tax=Modicella reniformis TaxID=1440133 RepID=A0A9P6MGS3_9FUNG|nr:hypothetical protein BGZ65_005298 [Modicella reniformis]
MATTPKSPFELTEIRRRLSLFLSPTDAIACAQVCKSWSNDFVSAIWHTIEESSHYRLGKLNPCTIAKHGHRIRVINGLSGGDNLIDKLQDASISKLKSLSMVMSKTSLYMAHCHDFIHRNINSLTSLDLSMLLPVDHDLYFTADCLSPFNHTGAASSLAYIKIQGLCLTRNTFSRLLNFCQALERIDIQDTFLQSTVFTDKFQHPRLTHLTAPVEQVFYSDPFTNKPSILFHFPNLTHWETWKSIPSSEIEFNHCVMEITQYSPHITALYNRTGIGSGGFPLSKILVYGLRDLREICVQPEQLSPVIIMSILSHRNSLTIVKTPSSDDNLFQSNSVQKVEDHLEDSGWAVQYIPSQCLQLQEFSLPFHEMNMDDVDRIPWMCHDLQVLHVRIKNLNTIDKINKALQMWVDGKKAKLGNNIINKDKEQATIDLNRSLVGYPKRQDSIEIRVARHLLRFRKLYTVWLGTKVWQV